MDFQNQESKGPDTLGEEQAIRGALSRESGGTRGDAFTIAVICPSCGGSISFVEGSTKVLCDHCGLSHIVVGRGGLTSFYIPKKVKRPGAIEAVRGLLNSIDLDERQKKSIRLIASKLVYIPFFRIKMTGAGWYIGEKPGKVSEIGAQTTSDGSVIVPREPNKKVMDGFFKKTSYFTPALDISELGVFGISTKSSVLKLHIFDPDILNARGMIFDPVKEADMASREAWSVFIASSRPTGVTLYYYDVGGISEERSLIYYPLWIVRLLLDGEAIRIIVDGLGGNVIKARIPKKSRVNVVPGIVVLSFVSFLLTSFPMIAGLSLFLILMGILVSDRRGKFFSILYRLFIKPWSESEVVIG